MKKETLEDEKYLKEEMKIFKKTNPAEFEKMSLAYARAVAKHYLIACASAQAFSFLQNTCKTGEIVYNKSIIITGKKM